MYVARTINELNVSHIIRLEALSFVHTMGNITGYVPNLMLLY